MSALRLLLMPGAGLGLTFPILVFLRSIRLRPAWAAALSRQVARLIYLFIGGQSARKSLRQLDRRLSEFAFGERLITLIFIEMRDFLNSINGTEKRFQARDG